MFVILIAIIATLTSIMFQFFMRGREISPAMKRTIWGLFIAGVFALVITLGIIVTR